ncbi:hypothetical protein Tco_1400704 [Tanacetum coccineum]
MMREENEKKIVRSLETRSKYVSDQEFSERKKEGESNVSLGRQVVSGVEASILSRSGVRLQNGEPSLNSVTPFLDNDVLDLFPLSVSAGTDTFISSMKEYGVLGVE